MFKYLAEFGYQRNKKEALGFYLAYLVLFILISGMLCFFGGGLFGFIVPAYFTTFHSAATLI